MKKSKSPPLSKLTPKTISINRLNRSKLMKIAKNEGNFENNENIFKPLNIKHTPYKIHDRNIKEVTENPFKMPNSDPVKKVRQEPFIMSEPRSICDIDSAFYTIIQGRPIRQLVDVKLYINNMREVASFRTDAALKKQEIIAIDTKHNQEVKQYNDILDLYEKTKRNFVQFTNERFRISKEIQKKAEEVAEQKTHAIDQLEKYYFRYVALKNKVWDIHSRYYTLLKYRKFLFSISPTYWLEKCDPSNYDEDSVIPLSEPPSIDLLSASSLMIVYKEFIENCEPPIIYFKHPEQLVQVYEDLRQQSLNYMQIDVLTSKMVKSMRACHNRLKLKMKINFEDLIYSTEEFENQIIYLEDKVDTYKFLFFKILNTKFLELCASYEALKLFNGVQYIHKQIFGGHEEPRDSIVTLMTEIETEYMQVSLKIDGMDSDIVNAVTKKTFNDGTKMMTRAIQAKRVIKESDILQKSLYNSFEPPRKFKPSFATRNKTDCLKSFAIN